MDDLELERGRQLVKQLIKLLPMGEDTNYSEDIDYVEAYYRLHIEDTAWPQETEDFFVWANPLRLKLILERIAELEESYEKKACEALELEIEEYFGTQEET